MKSESFFRFIDGTKITLIGDAVCKSWNWNPYVDYIQDFVSGVELHLRFLYIFFKSDKTFIWYKIKYINMSLKIICSAIIMNIRK